MKFGKKSKTQKRKGYDADRGEVGAFIKSHYDKAAFDAAKGNEDTGGDRSRKRGI